MASGPRRLLRICSAAWSIWQSLQATACYHVVCDLKHENMHLQYSVNVTVTESKTVYYIYYTHVSCTLGSNGHIDWLSEIRTCWTKKFLFSFSYSVSLFDTLLRNKHLGLLWSRAAYQQVYGELRVYIFNFCVLKMAQSSVAALNQSAGASHGNVSLTSTVRSYALYLVSLHPSLDCWLEVNCTETRIFGECGVESEAELNSKIGNTLAANVQWTQVFTIIIY